MKPLWMMPFVVLCVSAGQGESPLEIKNDPTLVQWSALVPPGWKVEPQAERLTVRRLAPIHVLWENKINAPVNRETPEETSARIRKEGKEDNARLVFRLKSKASVEVLWSSALPGFLSPQYSLDLIEEVGGEDQFHSVDPPEASREFWKVRKTLLASLAEVLGPDQSLGSREGGRVVVLARKSTLMSQHAMAFPPGLSYSAYIDWAGGQTVAYSRMPWSGSGPWELTGTVVAVGGRSEPGAKEQIREYHLAVESRRP